MTIDKIHFLIRSIIMMVKSDEFNFIKNNKICNIKDIHHTYFDDVNVYYNEKILYLIDYNNKIYYSFKIKVFDLNKDKRVDISNFIKNITPIRKSLGIKGIKYKNVDNFTCDLLQILMS
jgi:hypothetical protein